MTNLIEFRDWHNGDLFSINSESIIMVEPYKIIDDMTGLVTKECSILTINHPSFRRTVTTVTSSYKETIALINGLELKEPNVSLSQEELDMLLKNENNTIEEPFTEVEKTNIRGEE